MFLLLSVSTVIGQQVVNEQGHIECHGGPVAFEEPKDVIYETFYSSNYNPNARLAENSGAVFKVNYAGFSEEARQAFQAAVDIWAATLQSDVEIVVNAIWQDSGNPSNLGFARPGAYRRDFEGAPLTGTQYPIALAEKLARKPLNKEGEADVYCSFNSSRNDWYFGTDGATPNNQFDLVAVVSHELGHALGFTGSFFVNGSEGQWGNSGAPNVFDRYVVNSKEESLLDTSLFPNNSDVLARQLTSEGVFFDSELGKEGNGGALPKLYAPSPYRSGSSISHLDENTYSGSDLGLMTPFAAPGPQAQAPGAITEGMFADMGWVYTFIDHEEKRDAVALTTPFDIQVSSDNGYDASSVTMYYRIGEEGDWSMQMMEDKGEGEFSYTLDIGDITDVTIQYYFGLTDNFGREIQAPFAAENNPFDVYVGVDEISPVLTHAKLLETSVFEKQISIQAKATDNSGVGRVYAVYKVGETGEEQQVALGQGEEEDIYEGALDLSDLEVQQGDVLFYRVVTEDSYTTPNVTQLPAEGFYEVKVKEQQAVTEVAVNIDNEDNFYFEGMGIEPESNRFTSSAIHTPHPYKNSQVAFDEYLTYLEVPVIVTSENLLTFNEVVLTEPAQDYVVVEASKDNGKTWQAITESYDATAYPEWEELYYSNVVNDNSLAFGNFTYFQRRTIQLSEFFQEGEEVFIRFRMVVGATNTAWGWVIDDIEITNSITAINTERLGGVTIYPNPVQDQLRINFDNIFTGEVQVSVMNLTGQILSENTWTKTSQKAQYQIDFSGYGKGIYIVRVSDGERVSSMKILK
ncbi:hypothetical protein GCM10023331_37990 [Algivirga pacifica]|uniref:Secretion system C-terminal sorting domain-containing protein n=2 Tax=Algivirga pacifica TaxID=1162670 RepID=A0ABP9DPI0_9BACT